MFVLGVCFLIGRVKAKAKVLNEVVFVSELRVKRIN